MNNAQNSEERVKPTLLIVEDHEAVRASLRDWLKSVFIGSNIKEAKNGEEAVKMACDDPPDIVLMDINLPGMDGIEATLQIKDFRPQVQVVALTIYEDPVYRAKAMGAGASAYVPKRKMSTELIPLLEMLLFQKTGKSSKAVKG